MTSNSSKPVWDESLSGKHPKLLDLTVTEEEIRHALQTSAADLMSNEEKWLASRLNDAESYRANLEAFTNYKGKDRGQKIFFYRIALAGALGDLGRFDEAISILSTASGNACAGCKRPLADIKKIQRAVERDDDEMCQCKRDTVTVIDERLATKPDVVLTLNRRFEKGKVYSQKHKQVVTLWECRHCGHLNAHANVPERHQVIRAARNNQQIRAEILKAKAAGQAPVNYDIELLS